jgi:transposase
MNHSSQSECTPVNMPIEIAIALQDLCKRIDQIEKDLNDQKKIDQLITEDVQKAFSDKESLPGMVNIKDFTDKHIEQLRQNKIASLKRAQDRIKELKNDIELAFSS